MSHLLYQDSRRHRSFNRDLITNCTTDEYHGKHVALYKSENHSGKHSLRLKAFSPVLMKENKGNSTLEHYTAKATQHDIPAYTAVSYVRSGVDCRCKLLSSASSATNTISRWGLVSKSTGYV